LGLTKHFQPCTKSLKIFTSRFQLVKLPDLHAHAAAFLAARYCSTGKSFHREEQTTTFYIRRAQ
jgi:hypothetical protein